MTTCPAGHTSTDDQYCDTCGLAVGAVTPSAPTPARPDAGTDVCAVCRAPLQGRFCEECGHDNALPPPEPRPDQPAPPAPVAGEVWTAVVRADRDWFDEVRARNGPDADRVEFPRYCPERRFALTGDRVAIGRRSRSRGTDPEIDLSGPPLDPGVSAQHALLVARADSGWDVVDLESTNGTSVGDSRALLTPHAPVPLAEGDSLRIGAWTTITLEVARDTA